MARRFATGSFLLFWWKEWLYYGIISYTFFLPNLMFWSLNASRWMIIMMNNDFLYGCQGRGYVLAITALWHDLPHFIKRGSSARESSGFKKVKRRFLRCLWLPFAALWHGLPTVVKLPDFYYVLTTIRCRNLPQFAPFCRFSYFSWQNDLAGSALIIVANRGIRRQIGALERRL